MTLKPLADHILIKQVRAEETTKSGIILTSAAKEKPPMYEVIEVGPGGMIDGSDVKMTIKKDDRIIVGEHTGTEIKIDGEIYIIVKQNDVLATVE